MKILFNFASRSRPEKFFKCLDNIHELSVSDNYVIVAKLDKDDPSMNNQAVVERLNTYPHLYYDFGYSKNKVHAINRDIPKDDWGILVNMSDDMLFLVKGFDNIIREAFDRKDLFVHFPDGHVQEMLCTMSIMDRVHYDRFGYVYHPDYTSLWCDNEANEVAIRLKAYKYVPTQIFEHKHPAWTGERPDEQLVQTQRYYYADGRIYEQRKAKNFDLINPNTIPLQA